MSDDRTKALATLRRLRGEARTGAPWPNDSLETFLDGLAGWLEDCDGWYANRGEPAPESMDWTLFGQALEAACHYE